MSHNFQSTIVALATPPGRGGIGVIRISGPGALDLARVLVADEKFAPVPRQATLCRLHEPATGVLLDHALVTHFVAPHSFTGEDVIELSCHGAPVLLSQIIDALLQLDARAAGPGEFTLRAVANGRMNLSQAEAVRDLINAQTGAAAANAARQLNGALAVQLRPWQDTLIGLIVQLESALEFVEDDLPDLARENIATDVTALQRQMHLLAGTFRTGRLFRDGLRVALAGRPNAGKSSLFNALLAQERAIVTPLAGTTRDTLSEYVALDGVPVQLIDTAGLREAGDLIESLGIERTRRAIADADITIIVLDGTQPTTAEDTDIAGLVGERPHLYALNKSDLESFSPVLPPTLIDAEANTSAPVLAISAKTGAGLDALRTAILAPFAGADTDTTGLLITDARHHDLLRRAAESLHQAQVLLTHQASEELILVGLHDALRYLGQITGETTTEDILTQIFSTFCVGK